MSRFADTPEPPYYAVIFTAQRLGRERWHSHYQSRIARVERLLRAGGARTGMILACIG